MKHAEVIIALIALNGSSFCAFDINKTEDTSSLTLNEQFAFDYFSLDAYIYIYRQNIWVLDTHRYTIGSLKYRHTPLAIEMYYSSI